MTGPGKGRLRVALLGATGVVGQRLARRLFEHPWFELAALAGSTRSAGCDYGEAARWRLAEPMPEPLAGRRVVTVDEVLERADRFDLALSAVDAETARAVELELVRRGVAVVTNASPHRMLPAVPLVVPEVNPEHLGLLDARPAGDGLLVANPNCATIGLVLALKPLVDAFGLERVAVTTLQAASGAGHPGVPALDLLGNVLPGIAGEEEKLEREPARILGRLGAAGIEPATIAISAQTNRVAVLDGHLLSVAVTLGRATTPAEVEEAILAYRAPAVARDLPSAPALPVELVRGDCSPQPRLDAGRGGGMTVSVGRVRACAALGVRFVALVHNAERGAAGGTLLLAELAARAGYLRPRRGAA